MVINVVLKFGPVR